MTRARRTFAADQRRELEELGVYPDQVRQLEATEYGGGGLKLAPIDYRKYGWLY